MKTKICRKCKCRKRIKQFSKELKRLDGLQVNCKRCQSIFQKNRNKSGRKKEVLTQVQKFVLSFMKERGCADCGERDPIVLEFDHRNAADKTDTISRLVHTNRALKIIRAEMEKCDIRCANCHRRKTAIQLGRFAHIDLSAL